MPGYPFMLYAKLDTSEICQNMKILRMLGVPYTDDDLAKCDSDIDTQLGINKNEDDIAAFKKRYSKVTIEKFNNKSTEITDMDALIAYLQGLGNKVDLQTNRGRDW